MGLTSSGFYSHANVYSMSYLHVFTYVPFLGTRDTVGVFSSIRATKVQ